VHWHCHLRRHACMNKRPRTHTQVLVCTATYLIRVFESTEGNSQSSPYLWDQMWLVIVTSTTTGYGDIVPQVFTRARLACVLACATARAS